MLDLKVRERVGGGAWGEELDLPPTICVNNKNNNSYCVSYCRGVW